MLLPILALAKDKLGTSDTAWVMMFTALVLLITPAGLALFTAVWVWMKRHTVSAVLTSNY